MAGGGSDLVLAPKLITLKPEARDGSVVVVVVEVAAAAGRLPSQALQVSWAAGFSHVQDGQAHAFAVAAKERGFSGEAFEGDWVFCCCCCCC